MFWEPSYRTGCVAGDDEPGANACGHNSSSTTQLAISRHGDDRGASTHSAGGVLIHRNTVLFSRRNAHILNEKNLQSMALY